MGLKGQSLVYDKIREFSKFLTDPLTSDSNRLHCVEHSFSRPLRYKSLTRWSAVFHCVRVIGCSGNVTEVDEGKAFLVFDGVMSVKLLKNR